MKILINIISVICSILLAYLGTCFQKSYIQKEEFTLKNVLPSEMVYFIICLFWYVVTLIIGVLFYQQKEITFLQMIEVSFFWNGLYLVSWTDFKVKKIPNTILKILFIAKLIGVVLQVLIDHQSWKIAVLSSFLGLLTAGISVLLCMIISKGQIGAGDVKLYALVGFYLGIVGFVNIMIYSILIAGLYSIIILIINAIKKKTKFSKAIKSTIPMAPFIFLGTNLYLIFL